VPGIVVVITPTVEFPPDTPFTCQVTAVFVVPVTVAVNCCVARVASVANDGEIETATCPTATWQTVPARTMTATRWPRMVVLLNFTIRMLEGEFVIVVLLSLAISDCYLYLRFIS
jgi:hypothetical protein